MANTYTLFSEVLNCDSREEVLWVLRLYEAVMDDEDRPLGDGDMEDFVSKCKTDEVDFDGLDVEDSDTDECQVRIYSESGDGTPDAAGRLVQAYFRRFQKETAIFTLTWADTCSKMRAGQFGGGAMVVTHQKMISYTTSELLADLVGEVEAVEEVEVDHGG